MTDEHDNLLAGYHRFRESQWPARRDAFRKLALGQSPKVLIIACSDSRVDPGLILDAGPGELFVVRNVANLVPLYEPDGRCHGTSAAIEYAVRVLRVSRILVMGHAMCGGVQGLLNGKSLEPFEFLSPWLDLASDLRTSLLAEQIDDPQVRQRHAERACVCFSLKNLRSFPWIAEREASGELTLDGFHFGIDDGVLERLQPDGRFAPVETLLAPR